MSTNLNTSAPAPLSSIVSKRLDAVRKRPGMYIGNTGPQGLHRCIDDMVNDFLQKAVGGDSLALVVHDDFSLTIRSNAATVSTAMDPLQGIAVATVAFTQGPSASNAFQSGIRNAWVLNALCKKMELRTFENGFVWGQDFIDGATPLNTFSCMGPQSGAGSSVRFWPDAEFFGEHGVLQPFDTTRVQAFFQDLAYLHPGVTFTIQDDRAAVGTKDHLLHFSEKTFAAVLEPYTARFGTPATEPALLEKTVKTPSGAVHVRIAFQLFKSRHHTMLTFANNQRTSGEDFSGKSGTHEEGFTQSVFRTLRSWQKANNGPAQFFEMDPLEGLAVAIHVCLDHAAFEGSTRATLSSPEAKNAVQSVMRRFLEKEMALNSKTAKAWLENTLRAVEVRNAGRTYAF